MVDRTHWLAVVLDSGELVRVVSELCLVGIDEIFFDVIVSSLFGPLSGACSLVICR